MRADEDQVSDLSVAADEALAAVMRTRENSYLFELAWEKDRIIAAMDEQSGAAYVVATLLSALIAQGLADGDAVETALAHALGAVDGAIEKAVLALQTGQGNQP